MKMSLEHRKKLAEGRRRARAEGKGKRVSMKCAYCGTISDGKPFPNHVRGCASRRQGQLPTMPPTPPIYTGTRGGRSTEEEKAYREGLTDEERFTYYKTVFEEEGSFSWEAMLNEVNTILTTTPVSVSESDDADDMEGESDDGGDADVSEGEGEWGL